MIDRHVLRLALFSGFLATCFVTVTFSDELAELLAGPAAANTGSLGAVIVLVALGAMVAWAVLSAALLPVMRRLMDRPLVK